MKGPYKMLIAGIACAVMGIGGAYLLAPGTDAGVVGVVGCGAGMGFIVSSIISVLEGGLR